MYYTLKVFAMSMNNKFNEKESKYGEQWWTTPIENLERGLIEQFNKKKWLNVALYAFFLHHRSRK